MRSGKNPHKRIAHPTLKMRSHASVTTPTTWWVCYLSCCIGGQDWIPARVVSPILSVRLAASLCFRDCRLLTTTPGASNSATAFAHSGLVVVPSRIVARSMTEPNIFKKPRLPRTPHYYFVFCPQRRGMISFFLFNEQSAEFLFGFHLLFLYSLICRSKANSLFFGVFLYCQPFHDQRYKTFHLICNNPYKNKVENISPKDLEVESILP